MSLVTALARQRLIAEKNGLQCQLLQNSAAKRNSLQNLSFSGGLNLEGAFALENSLDLDNISASTELMAVNAELAALKNYSSQRLNYLA